MDIDILGIDLAKRVFQLHGSDRRGLAQVRSKVGRAALLDAVRELSPRVIAMEACSSAHHWAPRFQEMGIEVRLISPQYVAAFVKTNKNDRNDAEAIVEAACRPAMRFVTVKSVDQQDMMAAHRVRELLVHQRTALISSTRFGVCSANAASRLPNLPQRSIAPCPRYSRRARANSPTSVRR